MTGPKKTPNYRAGPDSLLLHLLQATGQIAALGTDAERQEKMARMLRGIQKYQSTPIPPVERNHASVWQRGSMRLLHIAPTENPGRKTKGARSIILVPSLINGWEILDLLPDQSFARHLAAQGNDVYIIDWGDLRDDPEIQSMDDLLLQRLLPAIELAAGLAGCPVALAGYCMGGLLVAGVLPHAAQFVDRALYLAMPWDFHAGTPHLTNLVRGWAPHMLPVLQTAAFLPNSQIQSLFAMVDPEMAINKFTRFADMDDDNPSAVTFVAVEDWLRTGRDLPQHIARTCMQEWYLENRPCHGQWHVGGAAVSPDTLKHTRSLVVAPRRDKLVETQTARAFYEQLGKTATYMEPDCGHIGMMASPRAVTDVWAPINKWLQS